MLILLRRLDLVARRQRLRCGLGVLARRDAGLVAHLLQHEVAPLERAPPGSGSGCSAEGEAIMPASSAASAGSSTAAQFGSQPGMVPAEVDARGGLDAVGALAEVHGVQVLGEDLLLGPLALELVGERRLLQLLEERAVLLRDQRVLDELLGDRRGALRGALAAHVLPQRARDALVVDALVLVEALVLDRDHGVLDVRARCRPSRPGCGSRRRSGRPAGCLPRVVRTSTELRAALELVLGLELGQVLGDGHHHPEDRRDQREHRQRRAA